MRADIEFVLDRADGWYNHTGDRVVMFRERVGAGAIPQARVEVEADADSMVVQSVYIGNKRQIAKKMADRRSILSGLDLAGQSPDSLTIAEYLKALGNGSSRPAPPSGDAVEANMTVSDPSPKAKAENGDKQAGKASTTTDTAGQAKKGGSPSTLPRRGV